MVEVAVSTEQQLADLWQQVVAAAKGGHRRQAERLLQRIVKLDPRNERAWLWLCRASETPQRQLYCLERVLTLNPFNMQALVSLSWLGLQIPDLTRLPDDAESRKSSRFPCEAGLGDACVVAGESAAAPAAPVEEQQPQAVVMGVSETLRTTFSFWLPHWLVALVNGRLLLRNVSTPALVALLIAGFGSYLWASATDVPRNPGMQVLFGATGANYRQWLRMLLLASGVLLWWLAFGLLLLRV